jgi:uncharacterized protein YgbK (DUF1537 family)
VKGSVVLAAVADDDTGASDLAGMLADQGVHAILILDPAVLQEDLPQLCKREAIVLATASRAQPPRHAREVTRQAMRCAAALNPRSILIKYCSTFDSTEEGNIGPSLDVALDELQESFTIAVPALPVNGRTTCHGHHFVNGRLLSDSPMRHHPLTPMTNSNLVDHLQHQTPRPVGLTTYLAVSSGADAIRGGWKELRDGGTAISIVDCLDEAHAASIAEAACDLRLISGSSIFGIHLPSVWRRRNWIPPPPMQLWDDLHLAAGRGQFVVAGSCSAATAAQNAWLARQGAVVEELDVRNLLEGNARNTVPTITRQLSSGGAALVKTHSTTSAIAAAQQWGASHGWSSAELGLKISAALATLTREILENQLPEVLVCAGGETTGAICRALGVRALASGRNIQPGIPLCFPLQGPSVPMVLKSGNFGSPDFYGAAFQAACEAR